MYQTGAWAAGRHVYRAAGWHVSNSTDRDLPRELVMASLLIGRYTCIEETNNTKRNLMDIATCDPVQRMSLRFVYENTF
ncbi:hypothetical protein GUJ93_ZPchr0006g45099 [Zizania palustris]|uniref:Uncharacterized protein n=1 Tax=Zizania palustris TaxID=103762 RepID=A0A8J5SNI4_ZIZPA|nr:hypothetical protein GUJ93_ZPchr0006g45099 [Zizania palustris]